VFQQENVYGRRNYYTTREYWHARKKGFVRIMKGTMVSIIRKETIPKNKIKEEFTQCQCC
jgi:hypothetical protein